MALFKFNLMRILIYFYFLLSTLIVLAQKDSLSLAALPPYQNDFEANVHQQLVAGGDNIFEGLLVITNDDSELISRWEQSFERRIESFKAQKRPKKDAKYVQKIYDFVHEEFLRKYEPIAYFDQIYSNGIYNCVTACALYALVFESLDLPYEIKETPTHVYIVAFPDTDQIRIETTDPIGGYKAFSPGFKQSFVNQLVSLKLIDRAELTAGVNVVFEKYYFTQKEVTLKQLVGIQYYNHGLVNLEEEAFEKAFHDFRKAYAIYPDENIKEVMYVSAILLAGNLQYDEMSDVELLAMLIAIDHPDVTNDQLLGEFSKMINKQLNDKADTTFVSEAYHMLTEVADDDLNTEFAFHYNYERGRLNYNRGNYLQAIPFCKAALKAKPSSYEGENLLVSTINNAAVSRHLDNEELFGIMDEVFTEFPNITKNAHLGTLRVGLYLQEMSEAFERRDEQQAKAFQTKFQELMETENYNVQPYLIGKAYASGITYYFRKGWYKSARKLLNEGLELAPDNPDLKLRKYYLDQAQY